MSSGKTDLCIQLSFNNKDLVKLIDLANKLGYSLQETIQLIVDSRLEDIKKLQRNIKENLS